jgi:hypothetical protein
MAGAGARTVPRADRLATHPETVRRRIETMLNDITRNRLVALWFVAVAVVIASVVAMGVNIGVSTAALLLTLSLVPPGIILILWRGPAQTVGEILYAANKGTEGRS